MKKLWIAILLIAMAIPSMASVLEVVGGRMDVEGALEADRVVVGTGGCWGAAAW